MASLQELELDEISEWPLLPQLLVILLIMLLIQGAGYWFYLMPKQDVKAGRGNRQGHTAHQSQ